MTGIMDTWQSLVLHWQYRVLAVIGVCTVGFLLGIPCTTQVPTCLAYTSLRSSLSSYSGIYLPSVHLITIIIVIIVVIVSACKKCGS